MYMNIHVSVDSMLLFFPPYVPVESIEGNLKQGRLQNCPFKNALVEFLMTNNFCSFVFISIQGCHIQQLPPS